MSAIALRSPQYKSATAGTGANSAKLTISIDGTIRYTLVKGTTAGATMLWEIAELCRDYISISFDGTYNASSADTLTIISTLTSHASTNGTGTALTTSSITDKGFDAYGTFMELSLIHI